MIQKKEGVELNTNFLRVSPSAIARSGWLLLQLQHPNPKRVFRN